MKNDFFSYLDGFNLINIIVPKKIDNMNKSFVLKSVNQTIPLHIEEITNLGRETKYTCEINETISLNESYNIFDEHSNQSFLRIGKVVRTDLFDMMFEYDDLDLGVTYSKEKSIFKLWSPVAKEIELEIVHTNGMRQYIDLMYQRNGLWSTVIFADLEKAKYRYRVRVNESFKIITDPYAIASDANGEYNFVVDPSKFRAFKHKKPYFSGRAVDAIIYEASIRDLTSSKTSKAVHKRLFKGLLEGHKDEGLDYISSLGVSHIQLLPIFDFEGVDELEPKKLYNWGYNPSQYNVVEGSFSEDPNDPYMRINELIEVIDYIHSLGMRVSMDVVYNHVYNMRKFPFEGLVPGYFFRFDKDGIRTNSSGCDNDIATERTMVHHFIRQSLLYWMKTFNLSAFRFDLMGLMDVSLINKLDIETKEIDSKAIIYGEGWNMESFLPNHLKSNMDNARLMPNVGFFNDKFRDTIKGGTFSNAVGYALGGKISKSDLYYLFTGSSVDFYRFINPNQSINYIECHDNHTFYDRARILRKDLSDEHIEDYARLGLSILILSQGVPFIHAGQSFLRTKKGVENSYKSPDDINEIDWDRQKEYEHIVKMTRDLITIRKSYKVFRLDSVSAVKSQIRIADDSHHKRSISFMLNDLNKQLRVYFKNDFEDELLSPGKEYKLIFDGYKRIQDNGPEILVNKPGAYIFVKE